MLLRVINVVIIFLFNGLINSPIAHPHETKPSNHSGEKEYIHKNTIGKLDDEHSSCAERQKHETCNSFKKIETTLNGLVLIGIDSLPSLKNKSNIYGRALVSLDINTISKGGIEYGSIIEVIADKRPVAGFKQKTKFSCINSDIDCFNENLLTGMNNGHESQFYYNRNNLNNKLQTSLETASFYLSSPYGDFFIGADMGAAHLFSIGSIDLYDSSASSIAIDYTGLNSVRTTNNVTGKAKKIIYISPRLLGDSIGAGFEFGVSYAPNSIACGIEYCEEKHRENNVIIDRPDLKDIIELGVAIDRNFKKNEPNKVPKFLWNAKMRFGKTFAAYQLALEMGWKKILVLTFKPAVKSAWQEDIHCHKDFDGWQFISREGLEYADADKSKPFEFIRGL